ncbi:ParB/RepB/Spo0J family partition protein [Tautonia plasticadhaerens]|uniref:Putative chromosome-partitioning protein ParB n=1 Tax=Tautonia plasticadhaerens TaxID=2527974 RepID=A0A518GVU8_9BACT|nr:ParB/RepB/Spo0J family partition protein [Tautonia plasticadhaerens]QDV32689.1 putative chromosome-partitioning protein ParB [Tautonia plasticadhaerens]
MTKNTKRLGRGLTALLGTDEGGFEPGSLEAAELAHLAVDQIDPNPYQPRRIFDADEIASLADSLRQHGMLQPILVRPSGERFQVIAGERRLRAAVEAHLAEVPARILELDDQRVNELAIVENLQRKDLNAIEKAQAFRNYLDSYGGTQEELAGRLGIDRSTLSNLLRLLDLPEELQHAVVSEQISPGHARALLSIQDPSEQAEACRRVIGEKLSVRQTEALVKTGEPTPGRARIRVDQAHAARPPHVSDLEDLLKTRFETNVLIKVKGEDKGQIVIDFATRDQFERISGMIRGGEWSPAPDAVLDHPPGEHHHHEEHLHQHEWSG